ncbi:hypothetical protein IWX90DRAFT_176272 [Phyllosticta citrichinensis]|uniref:Uncharacterized protein n=1 Tax=Phyllosticta citrichinensis TaxID=1130410 RepID=A0ABR1XVD6_9PEZI
MRLLLQVCLVALKMYVIGSILAVLFCSLFPFSAFVFFSCWSEIVSAYEHFGKLPLRSLVGIQWHSGMLKDIRSNFRNSRPEFLDMGKTQSDHPYGIFLRRKLSLLRRCGLVQRVETKRLKSFIAQQRRYRPKCLPAADNCVHLISL